MHFPIVTMLHDALAACEERFVVALEGFLMRDEVQKALRRDGEIVSATVPIVYVNEDKVQGIFEAELSEVHYKADPAHLLEPVEIDLAALPQTTKTMYVKDLKLEEKGVHVTTSGEQQLFHIGEYGQEETDETEETEETK